MIGNGSFGVVFLAKLSTNNEMVAIKKVLQDKRFKNRELQIMRKLNHPNIVKLKYFFYSSGDKKDELYLNLILEYVPETVYRYFVTRCALFTSSCSELLDTTQSNGSRSQ